MGETCFCKHCQQQFVQSRSNHLYCSPSCRTKASYKRNNYKYVSGHYEKREQLKALNLPSIAKNDEIVSAVQSLERRIEQFGNHKGIGANSVKDAALGTMAADASVYAIKSLLAPKSLPATRGDLMELKQEINNLKILLNMKL